MSQEERAEHKHPIIVLEVIDKDTFRLNIHTENIPGNNPDYILNMLTQATRFFTTQQNFLLMQEMAGKQMQAEADAQLRASLTGGKVRPQ